ncbi:MAG: tRNA-dihydrouridine synthase family protein [Desulfobulbaceae bacterium]|nr:tRNA-dihydrouridine synthase family protein [Desulfobulbaceae bacterium]
MLKIRNLVIDPPLLLAPMAGLTHSAFRTVLLSFGGVGLLSTEMLSARRLPAENKFISPYLVRTSLENPLSYQLLVTATKEVGPAVKKLHSLEANAIDLNLGCPAPRIRKAGGGCLLMGRPEEVRAIVSETRRLTSLPLSAKIRLGEEFNEAQLRDFCLMLEGEGIDMVTVHARLRKEQFCRKPHYHWVAKVKQWLSVPVIANGSVFGVDDARRCLEISGADGIMIGRGAVSAPWIFRDIAQELYGFRGQSNHLDLPAIFYQFATNLEERFRPERRLGRLKEFTHYFKDNYLFGHRLAMAVQSSSNVEEAISSAVAFFERNEPQGLTGMQAEA